MTRTVYREAILLGALATLAATALMLPPETQTPTTPTAADQSTVTEEPPATGKTEPATGEVAATDKTAEDRSQQLELPDGTFVATLNDAVDAAPIAQYWGRHAWSPIVGVERSSAGIDWYRHENGSFSTTQMVWRSDLGQHLAMTRVAHVGPEPAPVAAGGAGSAGKR